MKVAEELLNDALGCKKALAILEEKGMDISESNRIKKEKMNDSKRWLNFAKGIK